MRRNLLLFVGVVIATLPLSGAASAEIVSDGAVDLTFDAGGFTNGEVSASAMQADGKVIIAGSFTRVHGVNRRDLARLNTDGSVDQSFLPWDATSRTIYGILLLPDSGLLMWVLS